MMPTLPRAGSLSEEALVQHNLQQSLVTSDANYVESVVRAEAARLAEIAMAAQPRLHLDGATQPRHLYGPVLASNMPPIERYMVLNTAEDPNPIDARLGMKQASLVEGSLRSVPVRAQAASVLASSAASTDSSVLGQAEAGSK